MTIYDFAKNLWENMNDTDTPYTLDDAEQDLSNFAAEDWELPEGITPEALCAAMHEIISENAEPTEDDTDNSAYEAELRAQRDRILAEDTSPSRAWMIQEAYSITRNPYRGKHRK